MSIHRYIISLSKIKFKMSNIAHQVKWLTSWKFPPILKAKKGITAKSPKNDSHKSDSLQSSNAYCLHVSLIIKVFLCRYVETNIFFSSSYRQYSKSLPLWLHDRPRDSVTHCKLRHQYSEEIEDQHITAVDDGLFQVRSTTDHSTSYQVSFGDSENMPSCSCLDWQRNHWPCKHFLAIFRHKPQWGWDKLSPSNQNSPYFRIN